MWWIAAGSIFNISDTVAGTSPLASSWSQITYGQTNIKIFTVHVLLLKIKPGLFASVTLPWTHLFLSQFTHLCGMCFCFIKKQLLCHPQVQVLLVDSASKPSRCSPGNNPILVPTAFGVKMLLSPSLWKTCECFLFPTSTVQFQLLSRERAALRGGGPWDTAVGIQALPNLTAVGCAGCGPTVTQASPGDPWGALLLGIDSCGRLTDKTSKTFHFESSFHSLLLENTN